MKTDNTADSHRICQPGTDTDNIKIDPEFAELLPPLAATPFQTERWGELRARAHHLTYAP
jgi:hypothetical protein